MTSEDVTLFRFRVLKSYKACTASRPLETIGSCTNAQATLINNLYDIYFSVKACGINQDNPLFTTFAGPVRCNAPVVG